MNYGASITYRCGTESLAFHREGDFWLTETPDLSSIQVEVAESATAGQVGTTITQRNIKGKSITFNGSIVANVEVNREKMLRVIRPGEAASITYSWRGTSWVMEGTPTRTPSIKAGLVVCDFQFVFRAAYPYWKSTRDVSTAIAGLTPKFFFPFYTGGQWYISLFSTSFYNTVVNRGNVPVEFMFTVYASAEVVNPVLTHVDKKTHLALNYTMTGGEMLRVCTVYGKRGVTLVHADGSEENAFRYLAAHSDLAMNLVPGENLMRFDAERGRQQARAMVVCPEGVVSGV